MNERTIKKSVAIEGVGLQTGERAKIVINSAPARSGITFIRTDLDGRPSLNIKELVLDPAASKERRTVIGSGPFEIQTTEHFLAALTGLGIDNANVEMSGPELPGLDGSAKEFVENIKSSGIEDQNVLREIISVDEPLWCEGDGTFLAVFPDKNFKISYTLAYPHPAIGTQFLSVEINEENFINGIAPARTFCLEEEAAELLRRGLGKGANYDNTLVMGKAGPVKTALRFIDEPVRHKVLDLIGDLALLGSKLKGHVVAIKSGHRLNMELVKKLKK